MQMIAVQGATNGEGGQETKLHQFDAVQTQERNRRPVRRQKTTAIKPASPPERGHSDGPARPIPEGHR